MVPIVECLEGQLQWTKWMIYYHSLEVQELKKYGLGTFWVYRDHISQLLFHHRYAHNHVTSTAAPKAATSEVLYQFTSVRAKALFTWNADAGVVWSRYVPNADAGAAWRDPLRWDNDLGRGRKWNQKIPGGGKLLKQCQDRLWMNSHGIKTQFLEDQNPPVSSWWFWDGVFIGFPTFGAQGYQSSHQRSLRMRPIHWDDRCVIHQCHQLWENNQAHTLWWTNIAIENGHL